MGRRPSYEVSDVLRNATALFRKQGFHRVSVDDLVDATGLNRFALYEKFGGKEGLFYATLDFYYGVMIHEELLGPLREDDACIDSILTMLGVVDALNSDLSCRSGCLIVNANIELGGTDERVAGAVGTVLEAFAVAIAHALKCAEARGHLVPGRSIKARTEHMVIQIQAFFALAYISRDASGRLLAGLVEEVASWCSVPLENPRMAAMSASG
jgi:TetR/AcrR family transcriptional repressor of nem operon